MVEPSNIEPFSVFRTLVSMLLCIKTLYDRNIIFTPLVLSANVRLALK